MAVMMYKDADGNWQVLPSVGPVGPAGQDGVNGASAYELAVAQGYTGTLAEWLAEILRKSDIANNLTTADTGKVLSALQGKVLKDELNTAQRYTLMYTNAAPASAYPAQTITLDLGGYQSVAIEYFTSGSQVGDIYRAEVTIGRRTMLQGAMVMWNNLVYGIRFVDATSANIVFGDGYARNYDTPSIGNVDNKYCVPYRIWGVKGV